MGRQQHKQRHRQQATAQAAGGRVLRLGECTAAAFVQVSLHLFASNVDDDRNLMCLSAVWRFIGR
jgi:hypothetical protein